MWKHGKDRLLQWEEHAWCGRRPVDVVGGPDDSTREDGHVVRSPHNSVEEDGPQAQDRPTLCPSDLVPLNFRAVKVNFSCLNHLANLDASSWQFVELTHVVGLKALYLGWSSVNQWI